MRPDLRAVAKAVLPLAYRGSAVECPICQRSFRRFVPRGVNLMCPGCWSYERHRFNMLVLRDGGLFQRPGRVLHLAPDPSLVGHFRRAKGSDYVTGDLYSGPLVDVQLDAHELPFPDDHFTLLVASHVLQQVTDDAQVLREFHRVLAPGGVALIQMPVAPYLEDTYEDPAIVTPAARAAAFGAPDHVRMYGGDIVERLKRPGFTVECLQPEGLTPEVQQRMGLIHSGPNRGSDIYRCTAR